NGISMCVCTSIPPGITYFPVASIVSTSDGPVPGAYSAAIISPSTSTFRSERHLHVRVHVDPARDHVLPGRVDRVHIGRTGARRVQRGDHLAVDEHVPI